MSLKFGHDVLAERKTSVCFEMLDFLGLKSKSVVTCPLTPSLSSPSLLMHPCLPSGTLTPPSRFQLSLLTATHFTSFLITLQPLNLPAPKLLQR